MQTEDEAIWGVLYYFSIRFNDTQKKYVVLGQLRSLNIDTASKGTCRLGWLRFISYVITLIYKYKEWYELGLLRTGFIKYFLVLKFVEHV